MIFEIATTTIVLFKAIYQEIYKNEKYSKICYYSKLSPLSCAPPNLVSETFLVRTLHTLSFFIWTNPYFQTDSSRFFTSNQFRSNLGSGLRKVKQLLWQGYHLLLKELFLLFPTIFSEKIKQRLRPRPVSDFFWKKGLGHICAGSNYINVT